MYHRIKRQTQQIVFPLATITNHLKGGTMTTREQLRAFLATLTPEELRTLRAMINDLNNPNSKLYKAVANAEKAAQLAAEFEAKIKLLNATKKSSSG